jgi:hypothetical protein
MEKVLRLVIMAAAMCGSVNGSAAGNATESQKENAPPERAPVVREFPEMNARQIAEDAAAHGYGAASPELFKIQILASGGIEIIGKVVSSFGESGAAVGVGRFTLKRGGGGERGFFKRIIVADLLGLREGELFHAVIYPSDFEVGGSKYRPRVYYLSPAVAYDQIKEKKRNVDAVMLQDRGLWAQAALPGEAESAAPLTPEQRSQARAAILQKRAAQGLPTDVKMDDFTLLSGKRYFNAIIQRVEADGVTIETDSGITKLRFAELPAETREKYGYDEAKAAAATEAATKSARATEAAQMAMLQQNQRAREAAKNQTPAPPATPEPKYSEALEHPDMTTIRKYVLESVLRDSTATVTRWNQIPLVSTFGATDEEQKVFLGVVGEINAALAKAPMKLTPGKEPLKLMANVQEDEGAAIHVYFCDSQDIPAISAKEHFRYAFRQGVSWRWPNADNTLNRAAIIFPRNHIEAKYFRHTVLTQMLEAIGFGGWPKVSIRSIYSLWNVETLQPLDAHLIAFLYGHVAAGMKFDQVKQAVNEFWQEAPQK